MSEKRDTILILASTSPRRKQLLEDAGLRFEIVSPPGEEAAPEPGEDPAAYAERAAVAKGLETAAHLATTMEGEKWVLAADTVVTIGGEILGKPEDDADALRMLERLAGVTHKVHTGFAIIGPDGETAFSKSIKTGVDFSKPTRARLEAYVATGEPHDKAGAYAIQGKGAFLVRSITGSYTNVVGLPVADVSKSLADLGVLEKIQREKW